MATCLEEDAGISVDILNFERSLKQLNQSYKGKLNEVKQKLGEMPIVAGFTIIVNFLSKNSVDYINNIKGLSNK